MLNICRLFVETNPEVQKSGHRLSCLFQETKAKQRLVSDLSAAIEELKTTVTSKNEELSLTKQRLDAMNRQIEEVQSQLTLVEQKYKDQQSKNSGDMK